MVYAPIVIPTLNRIDHLKRCIESIKKSKLAKETVLYIGLDVPPSEKYYEGYTKVKKYIEDGIDGFKEVRVIYHKENVGGIKNGDILIKSALKEFEAFIYSEDDNEFAPCFLDYMNSALEKYKDRDDILAVYAHRPSVKEMPENEAFITNYFSAYGFAGWKHKEEKLVREVNVGYIEELACSRRRLNRLKKALPESICYLCSTLLRKEPIYQTRDGRIQLIDTARIIHAIADDKYLLCSPIPMVKNWGYDGSGEHCNNEEENMSITKTVLCSLDVSPVMLPDEPKVMELNESFEKNRIIPYISAWVRIWIWRKIAKRKVID